MRDSEEEVSELPTVHVVDDDDSFRNSIVRLLSANGLSAAGYRCAGEFLLADALDRPGCILLDITMPGPSGIELLKALRPRRAAPPVIFITGYDDVLTSVDVMKAGAVDYIVKPVSADRILKSVRKALQMDDRQRTVRHEVAELRLRFQELSPVERRIFRGIADSKSNKQLAAEVGCCERTIKAQRARMRSKLRIGSLPELVRASRLLDEFAAKEDSAEVTGLFACADAGRLARASDRQGSGSV